MNSTIDKNSRQKKYYTKFSHKLTDIIFPRLTAAQKVFVMVIVRLTVGWQGKESIKLSLSDITKKTGLKKKMVIRVKRELIAMGLIVVKRKGSGTRPDEIMLDEDYDIPELSLKARMEKQEVLEVQTIEEAFQNQEAVADIISGIVGDDKFDSEEFFIEDMEIYENLLSKENNPQEITIQSETPRANIQFSTDLCTIQTDHDPVNVYEQPSSPPQGQKLNNSDHSILDQQEKQTMAVSQKDGALSNEATQEKMSKKKAIAIVCHTFLEIFPDQKDSGEWKFSGWIVKHYGLKACLEALEYARNFRKDHSIITPKAWIKAALAGAWQPSKWINGKIKAERKAKVVEQERIQRDHEWEAHRQQVIKEQNDPALMARINSMINACIASL